MECQLPVILSFDVDSTNSLPSVKEKSLREAYDILGAILGLMDYQTNLASFWVLDIVTGALTRAQSELLMTESYQRVLLLWFGFVFQHVRESCMSREEVFGELKMKALTAGANITAEKTRASGSNGLVARADNHRVGHSRVDHQVDHHLTSQQCQAAVDGERCIQLQSATQEILAVMEIIYDIFANPFAFTLVRTAFRTPPEVIRADYPYTIHFPKKLKRSPPAGIKTANKNTRRTSATPEDSRTGTNRSLKHRRDSCSDVAAAATENPNEYILPLKEAVTQELFDKMLNSRKLPNDDEHNNSPAEQSSISDLENATKKSSISEMKRRVSKMGINSEDLKLSRTSSRSKTDLPQAGLDLLQKTELDDADKIDREDNGRTSVKRNSKVNENGHSLTRPLRKLENEKLNGKNKKGQNAPTKEQHKPGTKEKVKKGKDEKFVGSDDKSRHKKE